MQTKRLALFLFLLIGTSTYAQDWTTETYKYDELYPGFVVTKEGEKILGFIKYRNRFIMQEEIIFFREENNPRNKKRYYPADLLEYKVADKHYRCTNYSGGASINDIRGNLIINEDGCIKEYVWYSLASGYNTMTKFEGESDEDFGNRKFPSTPVFFKEGDEMAVGATFFEDNFVKKVSSYVSKNKELVKKIKAEQIGYNGISNLRRIFHEYDASCSEK